MATVQTSYERSDIRLEILRILANCPQYTANQETLIKSLKDKGHVISRDQLHIELCWLEQTAAAIIDKVSGGVHIAILTLEGQEIADGVRVIPGISRPLPE
jgi:hypothetical protein